MDAANPDFRQRAFSAPPERIRRFAQHVARTAGGGVRRVLDIGCGSGELVRELARHYPQADLTGIDISGPNIERAVAAAGREMSFVAGDYLDFRGAPFDLIVSYSTLHLIAGRDADLMGKLSADLSPGGLLVTALPYECAYNACLLLVRRLFRAFRSDASDRLVLALARAIAPSSYTEAQLRERVGYMYLVPQRMDGAGFRELAARAGLQFLEASPEMHASLAQPKHRLVTFRKLASP